MFIRKFVLQNFGTFTRISTNPHDMLYEIITVRLGCRKTGSDNAVGVHNAQRMALGFLQQYHKDGNEFLNHVA
jgi:hypothetical protein